MANLTKGWIKLKTKKCCALLLALLMAITFTGCGDSVHKGNDEQQQEVENIGQYIIEHGTEDDDGVYSISEASAKLSEIEEYYRITYDEDNKTLNFGCMTASDDTKMLISMDYEPGLTTQQIDIVLVDTENAPVYSATAAIDITDYGFSSKMFTEYECDVTNDNLQSGFETATYEMLMNCQLLLIDARSGLVPLGFEGNLYE